MAEVYYEEKVAFRVVDFRGFLADSFRDFEDAELAFSYVHGGGISLTIAYPDEVATFDHKPVDLIAQLTRKGEKSASMVSIAQGSGVCGGGCHC